MSSIDDIQTKYDKLREQALKEQEYHDEPRENLSSDTVIAHQAIVSAIEEFEAMDWYMQRADTCENAELREILLHNMREEMEHASMLIEWLRRNNKDFNQIIKKYIGVKGPIVKD